MTLGDAKREILNLGFETESTYEDEPSILTDAINRAMREITNAFPIIGEYRIAQNPLKNLLPHADGSTSIRHYDGTAGIKDSATGGKSLYFECSGAGTLTITDDDGKRDVELASSREFKPYREFVRGRVGLEFSGNFSYDVKNLAVYGELYSDRIEDIPAYRRHVRYDLRELTKVPGNPAARPPENDTYVFIDLLDKVREGSAADGESYVDIKDFQIEKRHILVLDGFEKAEYTIFYRKNFNQLTVNTPESYEFELDFDKEHLVPLLAAWYVWADDEPTKAAKWRNDYEDFAARLLAQEKPSMAVEPFINDLGW